MIYGAYFTPEELAAVTGRTAASLNRAHAAGELPGTWLRGGSGWLLRKALVYHVKFRTPAGGSAFCSRKAVEIRVALGLHDDARAQVARLWAHQIEAELYGRTFPAMEPEASEALGRARESRALSIYRRLVRGFTEPGPSNDRTPKMEVAPAALGLAAVGRAILKEEREHYEPGRARCLGCGERFESCDVLQHRVCEACESRRSEVQEHGLVFMEVGF